MVIAPTIQVASLGMADTFILLVMALVVFGPRRLPQIGRQIGKLMYEFRKASNDFKFQMEEELRSAEEADRRKQEEERLRALALAAPAAAAPAVIAEPSIAPPASPSGTASAEGQPSDSLNAAALYDNGPIAIAQTGGIDAAPPSGVDAVPAIRPPSIGTPVSSAGPWHREYQQAKAGEEAEQRQPASSDAAAVDSATEPASASPELPQAPGVDSHAPSSQALPAESIAVNHHG